MEREHVVRTVTQLVREVLPEVPEADIGEECSLTELGATSMDRVEVTVGAMEALGLALPPEALAGIGTIGGLVDLLWSHGTARHG